MILSLIDIFVEKNPGTLVEARGVVEFYNSKAQLKLFCMNNVYDYNLESLWWINIFENLIKGRLNTFITSDDVLNGELVTFASSIKKISGLEVIAKFNDHHFAYPCRKCHKATRNCIVSVSNNSRYRTICRMIVSTFNRSKSLYSDFETNVLTEEDIHFLINKILITNCNISKALRGIPVSSHCNL